MNTYRCFFYLLDGGQEFGKPKGDVQYQFPEVKTMVILSDHEQALAEKDKECERYKVALQKAHEASDFKTAIKITGEALKGGEDGTSRSFE